MAHRKVIATQTGRYGTRMLTAGDEMTLSGPAARAMIALGRAIAPVAAGISIPATIGAPIAARPPADERAALRAEYQVKFGKNPFPGWSADTLREKIAAA